MLIYALNFSVRSSSIDLSALKMKNIWNRIYDNTLKCQLTVTTVVVYVKSSSICHFDAIDGLAVWPVKRRTL